MKKITAFILVLVLLLTACLTAFADTPSVPPVEQISADPNHAEFIWRAPKDLTREITEKKIIYAETGIDKLSSSSVAITALTETNAKAYLIWMQMCIQRWEHNKWNNYATFTYSDYETTSYRASTTKTVEPGYYYRLAVTHSAHFLDDDDSGINSYTKSIYVN